MTTGQRIASKRKELKLSQENLGEQLGVSRQSIYKWESDTSLPEIDKLVAMSRLFGVSVGWLLGVEQDTETPDTPTEDNSGELTERQIKMVEEIVGRYVAAQPKPPKRKKWPYVLAAILMCCAGMNLSSRLDQLDSRYNNLQYSIGNISSGVNAQIGSITNRVEEILKAQNHLTADYSCEVLSADLANNTIAFSVRVVPKTYVEGMEVYFQADGGPGPTVLAAEQDGNVFTGEITCELTDSIAVSAVLVTGETRQTQLLDSFSGLYSASLPYLYLSGLETTLMHTERRSDGTFLLPECWGWIRGLEEETKFGPVAIQDIRVGLFLNYRPVAWLTPAEKPEHWDISDHDGVFFLKKISLSLETGDILHFAAIYTDEYGRTGVASCIPAFECMEDEISWMQSSDATPFSQIENYIL